MLFNLSTLLLFIQTVLKLNRPTTAHLTSIKWKYFDLYHFYFILCKNKIKYKFHKNKFNEKLIFCSRKVTVIHYSMYCDVYFTFYSDHCILEIYYVLHLSCTCCQSNIKSGANRIKFCVRDACPNGLILSPHTCHKSDTTNFRCHVT